MRRCTAALRNSTASSYNTPSYVCSTNSSSITMAPTPNAPLTCIVIGMAGSGKTTFMQRLVSEMAIRRKAAYVMNLDPAVGKVPYECNIDIRDTVNYKEVMKSYKLGPNGAIVTSLNLFATRFDQVLEFAEKRRDELDYLLLDTPGQIEVFTWSASGAIITESLASSFPTVIVYVMDTPRCQSPVSFMSNMMYACSIMYKTKLPFLIVFNKTDVVSHTFAEEWMRDIDAFEDALRSETSYMSTLTRSMAFVMDEFYNTINCVGVSAVTGEGMESLFAALDVAATEYGDVYVPLLAERKAAREASLAEARQQSLEEARKHMDEDLSSNLRRSVVLDAQAAPKNQQQQRQQSAAAAAPSAAAAGTGTNADDDHDDESGLPFDNFDYEQDRRDYEEFMREQAEKEQRAASTTS